MANTDTVTSKTLEVIALVRSALYAIENGFDDYKDCGCGACEAARLLRAALKKME